MVYVKQFKTILELNHENKRDCGLGSALLVKINLSALIKVSFSPKNATHFSQSSELSVNNITCMTWRFLSIRSRFLCAIVDSGCALVNYRAVEISSS